MRTPSTRAGLLAGAALCSLLLPSCLIGSNSRSSVSGTYIGDGTFEQVQPGDNQSHVLGIFGAPTTKSSIENETQLWSWEYEEERHSKGHIFLLINANSHSENNSSVSVIVKDGLVERIWRD